MKFLIAFALAVAVAHADVSHVVKSGDSGAEVVRSVVEVNPEGFQYSYETSNGISANANGVVKNLNSETPAQVVTGEFRYIGAEGTPYQVSYVADENGYQPKGDHLPVPPAIPELILRSLEYNAAHPQAENVAPRVSSVAQPAQQAYKPAQQAYKPAQQAFKKPYKF